MSTNPKEHLLPSEQLEVLSKKDEVEVSLGELVWRVIRGWKILVGGMALAGLVGIAVVMAFPRPYEAQWKVTVSPVEGLGHIGRSLLKAVKPPPELLQEYAQALLAPEVLEELVQQLREQNPDFPYLTGEELEKRVTITPVPTEGRLTISARMPNGELAKLVVATITRCGRNHLQQLLDEQHQLVRQTLLDQLNSARQAYQQAQERLFQLQQDQKYLEKTIQLEMTSRQVQTLQQTLLTTQAEIPKLQTRIQQLESLLAELPLTDGHVLHCEGLNLLKNLMGDKVATNGKESSNLVLRWERPSSLRQEIEKQILQYQSELEAIKMAHQEAQTKLEEALMALTKAQTEINQLQVQIDLAQWEVQSARNRYTAAQDAWSKWQQDAMGNLPSITLPPESWIAVRPKGLSALHRWLGIEMIGLGLAVVVILLKEDIRRQKPSVYQFHFQNGSYPPPEEILMSHKLSA